MHDHGSKVSVGMAQHGGRHKLGLVSALWPRLPAPLRGRCCVTVRRRAILVIIDMDSAQISGEPRVMHLGLI